jgi:hypothetical protein
MTNTRLPDTLNENYPDWHLKQIPGTVLILSSHHFSINKKK